jgi:hypothetical protein
MRVSIDDHGWVNRPSAAAEQFPKQGSRSEDDAERGTATGGIGTTSNRVGAPLVGARRGQPQGLPLQE